MRTNHRMRPDDGASADFCVRVHVSRSVDARLVVAHGENEIRFGDQAIIDHGRRRCANESATPSVEPNLEPETVAGHDMLPKLGVVHPAKRHTPARNQKRRDLSHRLDHQHRGHQGRAWKVPLKELFTDGDVLDGHNPASRLVLDDVIYEKRWVAAGEPVECLGDD